jgi:hypothetical protein
VVNIIYIYIYLTTIGLTPGGSSTLHIYTQTVHIMQRKENNIEKGENNTEKGKNNAEKGQVMPETCRSTEPQ